MPRDSIVYQDKDLKITAEDCRGRRSKGADVATVAAKVSDICCDCQDLNEDKLAWERHEQSRSTGSLAGAALVN